MYVRARLPRYADRHLQRHTAIACDSGVVRTVLYLAMLAGVGVYFSQRQKSLDDRYYSGLELGVTAKGLRFREGALAGEKLKLFFNQLVRSELGDRSIEDLALPLSIIATDIGSGERVAMRILPSHAMYCLPGMA